MKIKKLISSSLAVMLLASLTLSTSVLAKENSTENKDMSTFIAQLTLPGKYSSHLYEKITVDSVKKAILEMGECGLPKEQVEKYSNEIKENMTEEQLKEIVTRADNQTVPLYREKIKINYGFYIKGAVYIDGESIKKFFNYLEGAVNYDSLLKIEKDIKEIERENIHKIFNALYLGNKKENYDNKIDEIYKNNHTFDLKWKLVEEAKEYSKNHTPAWINNGYGWWYQNGDGSYPYSQWQYINAVWYYFDESGYMLADTQTPDGYYVDASGKWSEGNGSWINNGYGFWYQNGDGSYPYSQWQYINAVWYYFDANGYMQTGWINLNGSWYYLDESGEMFSNQWVGNYYVGSNGAMLTDAVTNEGIMIDKNGHRYI